MNRFDRATELADLAEVHHELVGATPGDFRQEVLLARRAAQIDLGVHVLHQGERVRLLHQDKAARDIGQGVLFTKGEGGEQWQAS